MSKVNMQMQINKLLNTAKPAGSLYELVSEFWLNRLSTENDMRVSK